MEILTNLVADAPRVVGRNNPVSSRANLSYQEKELLGKYMSVESSCYDCNSCNSCGSGDCNSCCESGGDD